MTITSLVSAGILFQESFRRPINTAGASQCKSINSAYSIGRRLATALRFQTTIFRTPNEKWRKIRDTLSTRLEVGEGVGIPFTILLLISLFLSTPAEAERTTEFCQAFPDDPACRCPTNVTPPVIKPPEIEPPTMQPGEPPEFGSGSSPIHTTIRSGNRHAGDRHYPEQGEWGHCVQL